MNLSQLDIARAAGIVRSTVAEFERGAREPRANSMTAIRAALEAAGVIFIDGDATAGPGARLRDPYV